MVQREAEIRDWAQRLADPAFRRYFVRKGRSRLEAQIRTPISWRLPQRLRKIVRRLGWSRQP